MSYTLADYEVARQKLRLTSSTISLNNFLTVWKGIPAIIEHNSLSNEVSKIWYPATLHDEEAECLKGLITDYIVENNYLEELEEDDDGEGR